MVWPFPSRRNRIRRQAADWIARLNGPHSAEDRAAFESWRNASRENAEAYDRMSAHFHLAARARPAGDAFRRPQRRRRPALLLAAAAGAVALAGLAWTVMKANPDVSHPRLETAAYTAAGPAERLVLLADGSQVALAAGSALEVDLGTRERRLRLVRGQGRFDVAHEARPFIVAAKSAQVVARGTSFSVAIVGDEARVALIEGIVDVVAPAARPGRPRQTIRMTPGQRLSVRPAPVAASAPGSGHHAPAAAGGAMLRFDETRLADAIDRVGRAGGPEILLDDPALGSLRVSGAFRAGDTRGFAQSVAVAFGLAVEGGPDGKLHLRSAD